MNLNGLVEPPLRLSWERPAPARQLEHRAPPLLPQSFRSSFRRPRGRMAIWLIRSC